MLKAEWINVAIKYVFQSHGDDRGQLVALEEFKDIPFRILELSEFITCMTLEMG